MTLGNMRSLGVSVLLALACATELGFAQVQSPMLNFSCEGKTTDAITGEKGEAVNNIGLVVNLAAKTVSFAGFTAPFNTVDAANIYFRGTRRNTFGMDETVDGNLDRVTGAVEASVTHSGGASSSFVSTSYWKMLCKPATRLF